MSDSALQYKHMIDYMWSLSFKFIDRSTYNLNFLLINFLKTNSAQPILTYAHNQSHH